MPFTKEDFERAKLRSMARKFASDVRECNMACSIPDEIFDKIPDDKFEQFFGYLREFRLVQRKDWLWERT